MGTFSWCKRAQISAKNTVNLIIIGQLNHAARSVLFCAMRAQSCIHPGVFLFSNLFLTLNHALACL